MLFIKSHPQVLFLHFHHIQEPVNRKKLIPHPPALCHDLFLFIILLYKYLIPLGALAAQSSASELPNQLTHAQLPGKTGIVGILSARNI
jgi:hypothetical protein